MKSKLASLVLSVFMATALWLYVITTVSPGSKQTYYNIPVVLANESVLTERGLMITYQSAATVTLELSGNRTDLSKVDQSNITLKADLSAIYEPGNQIPISYTTTFPGNVASNAFVIESKTPGRIYLNVERRISKPIPVEVKWIGSVPEGFIADRDNMFLEYPTIQITGPQSVTDQIEKAVIEVDLTDQRESISRDCTYTLCNAGGEPVDAGLITTNAEQIHLEVKIQRVKDVLLAYQLVEGGGARAEDAQITLSMDRIRVSGSEAALELMGDQLVVGVINLAEIDQDTVKTFTIPLEEGITNLTGVSEVTADIRLTGLSTKDFLIRQINVVNVPEGLEVELITQELTMKVRGPSAQIANLTADDVMVVVDFTGAEVGTATFPVRAVFTDGFRDVGIFKSESVSASVMPLGTMTSETTEEPVAPAAETEPEAVG
ncbi:MAG: YbbR-like domain-containing protein [Faecousia sp.]